MTHEEMRTALKSSTAQSGRPFRILVVDDDPLARNLMGAMLAPHGYVLDFACDGKEALEAIETRAPDLVFMDLVLPDINGREVCRQVRARESGKLHLPIVAVTAYDVPGQPFELVKAGMDDYIFKPYDLRTLRRIIQIYGATASEASSGGTAQAVRTPTPPVLDVEGPLQDFANDVEAFNGILRGFLESLPVRLGKMRDAFRAGNYEALGREAHSLKGISAGLGAAALSRLAGRLNEACKDGEQASAGELLGNVEQGMNQLQAAAQSFLASTPAQPGSGTG